jgi:uncharacterized membrane protein
MLKKLRAGYDLMKKGKRVSDPAKWKTRQIEASVIVAAIWSAINAASAFGVEVPVDAETVDAVAVALLAVVNVYLTAATTNKIGLPGDDQPSD